MIKLGILVAWALGMAAHWQPFQAQFMGSLSGRNVMICIDGSKVERTFAGKMGFRDASGTWISVCADVRSPVSEGQITTMKPLSTDKVGGNIAKAGYIVARYFKDAQTPDQCAGLQLAVWKAIEDGGELPDFTVGRLQARADGNVIAYAQRYYGAIKQHELAIQQQGGQGSQGSSGTQGSEPGQSGSPGNSNPPIYLAAGGGGQSQIGPPVE